MYISRTTKKCTKMLSFSLSRGIIDDVYSLLFANLYFPRICFHILYCSHNGKVNFFNKVTKMLPGCQGYGAPFSVMVPAL